MHRLIVCVAVCVFVWLVACYRNPHHHKDQFQMCLVSCWSSEDVIRGLAFDSLLSTEDHVTNFHHGLLHTIYLCDTWRDIQLLLLSKMFCHIYVV